MSNFQLSGVSFSSSILPSAVDDNSDTKLDVIRNTPDDLEMEKKVVEVLKEVRKELVIKGSSNESLQHMKLIELIDVVQRHGVAYHFEEEIKEALKHIYVTYGEKWVDLNNLHNLSRKVM
ncbi:putative beta-farnesene synthase [Helianthus annuus]|nr:putative beta-farnesene synthase [Helianthus annuus]